MKTFKEKILQEIEEIPETKKIKLLKIIQLLVTELTPMKRPSSKRGSLKGIWEGAQIEEGLINEAKKSLFNYEKEPGLS